MLKRSRLVLAMSFSAALLCGCGGTAESARPSPTASAAGAKDRKHQFEAAKADCMKQKGFKYVPYVKPEEEPSEEERKRNSGDYQAMRQYRKKYGFGVFSEFVYPKEIGLSAAMAEAEEYPDPNAKVVASLSQAQMRAYRKAQDACVSQAAKQALGLEIESNIDYFNQSGLTKKRLLARDLDGDPGLTELATSMATCLKSKGYTISDTKPTALDSRGKRTFQEQATALARKQKGDKGSPRPDLTPQQAKPYLTKEIKAALDDLECGKDFYPAYVPRQTTLKQQVDDQFAL
ncbi:hypothetical protein [Nonomuraea sp. KM88]|uniref:hypothetical protein n=1 Tax=Nonomuraea sp. KM88 TaxID=3457427 RepID=UPI003FCC8D05